MQWEKQFSRRAAAEGGWKENLPLEHSLPHEIVLDCSRLEMPIYPLFAIRLRTFLEWHADQDRRLRVVRPNEPGARQVFDALCIQGSVEVVIEPDPGPAPAPANANIVLPVTQLREFPEVEAVAERTREMLEYELTDVSALGHASYMAVSELCANAIEHGANRIGAFVAAVRFEVPRRQVSIAIGDLGIGIPEHLRQVFPEWFDDSFAIAQAIEPQVSGTGDAHRGLGLPEVYEATLVSAPHTARIDIHSANGFLRTQFYGGEKKTEPFEAAGYRRGTWISFDLVAI